MPERMRMEKRSRGIRCSRTRLHRGSRRCYRCSKSAARAATEYCEKVESLREPRLSLRARELA